MEKVHDYLVEYLRSKGYPEVKKHRHEYLCYYGFDQSHVYVLIEGVVKASVTMREGTEFNVFYMQGPVSSPSGTRKAPRQSFRSAYGLSRTRLCFTWCLG